jgi:hypothetical protein
MPQGDILLELTGVLSNDFDIEGSPLQAVLVSPTQHGSLILNPDGSFVYVPAADFVGIDRFVYVAFDGAASSAPTLVQIDVLIGSSNNNLGGGGGDNGSGSILPGGVGGGGSGVTQDQGGQPQEEFETPKEDLVRQLMATLVRSSQAGSDTLAGKANLTGIDEFTFQIGGASRSTFNALQKAKALDEAAFFTVHARRRSLQIDSSVGGERISLIFSADSMWDDLRRITQEQMGPGGLNLLLGDFSLQAGTLTVGAIAAYFLWYLRGGILVSMLLAQLPAWRFIDPLPLFEPGERDKDRAKLDPLETYFKD